MNQALRTAATLPPCDG